MNAIMTWWATPLTLGLFAVSAVSGVALFFHFGQGAFHEMHEWLSMVLLPPFALHMARNWTPLANYIKRSALWAPLGLSLVAAGAFAAPGLLEGGGGGPTARRATGHARAARRRRAAVQDHPGGPARRARGQGLQGRRRRFARTPRRTSPCFSLRAVRRARPETLRRSLNAEPFSAPKARVATATPANTCSSFASTSSTSCRLTSTQATARSRSRPGRSSSPPSPADAGDHRLEARKRPGARNAGGRRRAPSRPLRVPRGAGRAVAGGVSASVR